MAKGMIPAELREYPDMDGITLAIGVGATLCAMVWAQYLAVAKNRTSNWRLLAFLFWPTVLILYLLPALPSESDKGGAR
jgi:hypothetical protein